MPELPEVETIKNELLPHVLGRCVVGVTLLWEGIARQPEAKNFCSRLIGQRLTGLTRRGKYLLFNLSSGEALVIHLKMTGSLLLKPAQAEAGRFVRAVIHLDNKTGIHFRDPRKFGVMWLVKDADAIVGKLGPEPMPDSFTPGLLARRLARRTAPIKALLCDQGCIAGIGNMYADEALFRAGIHPLRPGGSLHPEEVRRLHRAIKKVLKAAIGRKGASVRNYLRPDGTLGTAHFQFQVAHRLGGELCPVCGTKIERITVRNRGTYFCPGCQPQRA